VIRRSSDDDEEGIPFVLDEATGKYVFDVATALAFVGGGNGYLVRHLNQGSYGSSCDMLRLTDSTNSHQPQIIQSGVPVTVLGKQSSYIDGHYTALVVDAPNLVGRFRNLVGATLVCISYRTEASVGLPLVMYGGDGNVRIATSAYYQTPRASAEPPGGGTTAVISGVADSLNDTLSVVASRAQWDIGKLELFVNGTRQATGTSVPGVGRCADTDPQSIRNGTYSIGYFNGGLLIPEAVDVDTISSFFTDYYGI